MPEAQYRCTESLPVFRVVGSMYEAWNLREVQECLELGIDVTPLPFLYTITAGQLSQVSFSLLSYISKFIYLCSNFISHIH